MKIAVLLSGGVDSAVALALLKEQGHDVTAFYLKIWMEEELSFLSDCPWKEDLEFVEKICEKLSVPLEVVPMQKEYFENVVEYLVNEAKAGRTGNPDVFCNNFIKFGLFLNKIDSSFEKVASGHYANTIEINGKTHLKMTPDEVKDQTYFLAYLKEEQLKRILFPIGTYTKSEVRNLAEKFDLPNKNRKDSQGICFLGKIKFRDFIGSYLGKKEGDIIEFETGKVIGKHDGYWFYTLGQRKDIKLSGGPYFVVKKEISKNEIFVSKNYFTEDKLRNTFEVSSLNIFSGTTDILLDQNRKIGVKIRHGEKIYPAKISKVANPSHDKSITHDQNAVLKFINNSLKIEIPENDQGITPGQFAVFYDGDICLGSGIIHY
jgi:tRNA-specific 2-thiouridylase